MIANSFYYLSVFFQLFAFIACIIITYHSGKFYRLIWLGLSLSIFLITLRSIHSTIHAMHQKIIHLDIYLIVDSIFSLLCSLVILITIFYFRKTINKSLGNLNKLKEIAEYDYLTNSYSRFEIFNIINNEIDRSLRSKSSFALLQFDIDHFKSINDKFGHKVGDEALVLLVNKIQKAVRSIDFLGRRGGDEFIILMPNTEVEEGLEAAERLRSIVSEDPFQFNLGENIYLKISIGITIFNPLKDKLITINNNKFSAVDELLARSDRALYRAKEKGRNQVRANF